MILRVRGGGVSVIRDAVRRRRRAESRHKGEEELRQEPRVTNARGVKNILIITRLLCTDKGQYARCY